MLGEHHHHADGRGDTDAQGTGADKSVLRTMDRDGLSASRVVTKCPIRKTPPATLRKTQSDQCSIVRFVAIRKTAVSCDTQGACIAHPFDATCQPEWLNSRSASSKAAQRWITYVAQIGADLPKAAEVREQALRLLIGDEGQHDRVIARLPVRWRGHVILR